MSFSGANIPHAGSAQAEAFLRIETTDDRFSVCASKEAGDFAQSLGIVFNEIKKTLQGQDYEVIDASVRGSDLGFYVVTQNAYAIYLGFKEWLDTDPLVQAHIEAGQYKASFVDIRQSASAEAYYGK